MWLVSGGAYQGKLDYVMKKTGISLEEVADGATCSLEEMFHKPVVNQFHMWIDRMLKENKEVSTMVQLLTEKNPEIIIIVNELGCGVVPVEPYDRKYREVTGRICCELARNANQVHRVICGIGTVIKHD